MDTKKAQDMTAAHAESLSADIELLEQMERDYNKLSRHAKQRDNRQVRNQLDFLISTIGDDMRAVKKRLAWLEKRGDDVH